jgi:hypothetical protein
MLSVDDANEAVSLRSCAMLKFDFSDSIHNFSWFFSIDRRESTLRIPSQCTALKKSVVSIREYSKFHVLPLKSHLVHNRISKFFSVVFRTRRKSG